MTNPHHRAILRLTHESKLLGILPMRKLMGGELVTLSVEIDNRSRIDIPGSEAEIVVLWADCKGPRPRLKTPIEPGYPGEREMIGPLDAPVEKAGVARGYLRLVTWPAISPRIFQYAHGRPLPSNQHQNWIPVGKFGTSSCVRLIGVVAVCRLCHRSHPQRHLPPSLKTIQWELPLRR